MNISVIFIVLVAFIGSSTADPNACAGRYNASILDQRAQVIFIALNINKIITSSLIAE